MESALSAGVKSRIRKWTAPAGLCRSVAIAAFCTIPKGTWAKVVILGTVRGDLGQVFRFAAAVALAFAVAFGAHAEGGPTASPSQLADRIQARAAHTSFRELQSFGDAAAAGSDHESLKRLQHVVTILRGQSEFGLAGKYNALLTANAARQGDKRYT